MRIGLDIDGVLYDFVEDTRRIAKILWPDRAADFDAPATCWDYFKYDWGLTKEDFAAIHEWGFADTTLFEHCEPMGNWGFVLDWLIGDGHTIHLVTHRPKAAVVPTGAWLAKHQVPYTTLTFAQDKTILDADVLVDDNLDNIRLWVEATGKPAIIYNQRWNGGLNHTFAHPNVWRYSTPEEIRAVMRLIERSEQRRKSTTTAEASAEAGPVYESALEEAQRLVHGDRGVDYGHPAEDMARTGRIWGAILGIDDVPAWQVALCMSGVKISREVNAPKRDNLVDLAGYAEVALMTYEKMPR